MKLYDNLMQVVTDIFYIIYARLSKEEAGKDDFEKSKSIQNQIMICQKYILEEQKRIPNCHFHEVAILADDGISGTTFERDDFKELIQLILDKKANMVITKDLSRFGRDHVKTDDYIEKWFPEHNVRYVSIMENVDTYSDCISNDIAPILNWANENFAKQTSKKIKKTFSSYRKEGKWTGGEPPLGYKIDPNDKYHFIIDLPSALVVRKIFELAKKNYSLDAISKILFEEKIPIPSLLKGNKRNLNWDIRELWSPITIKGILQNEMYLGHMIQGKTTRLNHKSNKIIYLPREQWNIVLNTHEAIIDKGTFDAVQLLLQSNKNKTLKTHDYLLKGLMRCRECNHSISVQHYSKTINKYTTCNYYRKYGKRKKVCTAHRQSYDVFENLVLDGIRDYLKYVNSTNFVNILRCKNKNQQLKFDLKQSIIDCSEKISNYQNQIDIIYEDKLNGSIDLEQYKRMLYRKKECIKKEEELKNKYICQYKLVSKKNKALPNYSKVIQEFLSLKNPSKVFITRLIEVIYLSETGQVDVYFKFRNPCSK